MLPKLRTFRVGPTSANNPEISVPSPPAGISFIFASHAMFRMVPPNPVIATRQIFSPGASALLNLNHAFTRARLDLVHAGNDLTCKLVERLGMGRVFAFENRGLAAVS